MAKEKKKRLKEQGKEVVGKKKDEKSEEKERPLPTIEKEKEAEHMKEVKNNDEGKSEGKNENQNKDGREVKEQGEKLEAPPAEPKPSPPSPPNEVVLKVFMHCEGCAKKVRKSLKGLEGVEDVKTDCKTNTVVVKGKTAAQDPKKVAETLYRKSGKRVEILSPAPAPLLPRNVAIVEMLEKKKEEKSNEKKEEATVVAVLKVHMHCEACAEKIKRTILKLNGVEGVETTLGISQVRVKGNFDPNVLVKYIYKRTGKHAFIVKQEQIPAAEKLKIAADAEPANGSKPENVKENEKKEERAEETPKEENKDEEESGSSKATMVAVSGPSDGGKGTGDQHYYYFPRHPMEYAYPYPYPDPYQYQYPPPPPPPPQMFSDENPNACIVM